MTDEPDADPFAGLGEGRSFRRVKEARGALARKVAACLLFVAGCLLVGLGFLMHMAQKTGWEPPFPFAARAAFVGGRWCAAWPSRSTTGVGGRFGTPFAPGGRASGS